MAQLDPQTAALVRKLVEEQLRMKDEELTYRLNNMSMKRSWEKDREDNLDSSHPIVMRTYIPIGTKQIQEAYLNLNLMYFRSYGAATKNHTMVDVWAFTETAAWTGVIDSASMVSTAPAHTHTGAYTSLAGGHSHSGSTSTDGSHNHGSATDMDGPAAHSHTTNTTGIHDHGSVGADGAHSHTTSSVTLPHSHGIFSGGSHSHTVSTSSVGDHDHTVTIPTGGGHTHTLTTHTHSFKVPAHAHEVEHGIFEGNSSTTPPTFPTNVGVIINGVDRTTELGGPFSTDVYMLDITKYLSIGVLNTIQITSATLGRIAASMFIEIYRP